MKNLVLFGIFVLFLVAVQFAGGRTADEIIEKHIRAKGGLDKLDAIQSIYMEGIIKCMGIASFIKMVALQNLLTPAAFDLQWLITDQQNCLQAPEHFNTNTVLLNELMVAMQTEFFLAPSLINHLAKGSTVVLIGNDVIEGITCYKLKLTSKEGKIIFYWINKDDFIIVQSSFENSETVADRKESILTRYYNYKPADEILFAHSIAIQMNGLKENNAVEILINTIKINLPVQASFLNQNQYNQS